MTCVLTALTILESLLFAGGREGPHLERASGGPDVGQGQVEFARLEAIAEGLAQEHTHIRQRSV